MKEVKCKLSYHEILGNGSVKVYIVRFKVIAAMHYFKYLKFSYLRGNASKINK